MIRSFAKIFCNATVPVIRQTDKSFTIYSINYRRPVIASLEILIEILRFECTGKLQSKLKTVRR